MKKLISILAFVLYVGSLLVMPMTIAKAQSPATIIKCGDKFENEFFKNYEFHDYNIDLAPGDSISITGDQTGDNLKYTFGLFSPTQLLVMLANDGDTMRSPFAESGVLSARGTYLLRVANSDIGSDAGTSSYYTGGTGMYTLGIGCKLKDGTLIPPGSNTAPKTTPNATPVITGTQPSTVPFSGNGFPGLPPVDFSNTVKQPLDMTKPLTLTFSPTGSDVSGFTVDAKAGDKFSLNYKRLSGNGNLGLAVLSEKNEVIFQASLVTSDMLTTTFTFPTAGTYTIGLFRVNLVMVANPQPTKIVIDGKIIP